MQVFDENLFVKLLYQILFTKIDEEPLLPKGFALETVESMKNCQYQEVWGNHQTILYGQGAKDTVKGIEDFLG